MEGDKVEARRKLNLPLDKKIIFAFGQKWRNMLDTVPAIRELSQKYPIKVVIVSGAQRVYGFNELDSEIRKAVLEHSGVYDYLHAADAMILGKHSVPGVVLSSTAHLCLGSGCPIIARDSNFFELMDREVLKYKDLEEFKENLISAFTEDERCKATKKAAREYVERNSAEKIAKRLIEVFKEVANHT
jgi:glycosyltransferase involved in cell wall biosynthesis